MSDIVELVGELTAVRGQRDALMVEIDRLREALLDSREAEALDEISALRAALVSIARAPGADNETAYEMRKIAREALGYD